MFITPRYPYLQIYQNAKEGIEETVNQVESLKRTIFIEGRFSMLLTPSYLTQIMRVFHKAIIEVIENRNEIERLVGMPAMMSILSRIQIATNGYMEIKNHFNRQACTKGLSKRFHLFKVLQEEQTGLKKKLDFLGIKTPVDVDIEIKKEPPKLLESLISPISTEHSVPPTPNGEIGKILFPATPHMLRRDSKQPYLRMNTARAILTRGKKHSSTINHSRDTTKGSISFSINKIVD